MPRRVLAFASWLEPALAAKVQEAVERLLGRGEAFSIAAASLKGRHFEIDGRAIAGRAVMRIRDVSGDRLQLARLRESHAEADGALAALRALLDAIPHPAWTRDAEGRVAWSNAAYARAVEAKDGADVASENLELFDRDSVRRSAAERRRGRLAAARAGGRGGRAPDVRGRRGRHRRPARRASPTIFPNSSRCAPKWSATPAPIRACSTNCRRRWRFSTAPNG